MKNGRFEPKDKSFSKRDKEGSEAGNCSYSSFVTFILELSGLATLQVTLMNRLNFIQSDVDMALIKRCAWSIHMSILSSTENSLTLTVFVPRLSKAYRDFVALTITELI